MPGQNGQRSKSWCFTLNNPVPEDEDHLNEALSSQQVQYAVYGREVGVQGTPHLQGYVEFRIRFRLNSVKRDLGSRLHLEPRRGTLLEAINYCKKDGDFTEFGVLPDTVPSPGHRTDLDDVRRKIEEGLTELDIAQAHWTKWVVYRRSFQAYRRLLRHTNTLRLNLRVLLLWGEAGTGKTRYAYDRYPNIFRVPDPELKWFDGYNNHDEVLIDDYRGNALESFFLQLLDIYPMSVPIKGGFEYWTPTVIIITTNMYPSQMHNMPNSNSREALRRRIHKAVKFELPMTADEVDAAENIFE